MRKITTDDNLAPGSFRDSNIETADFERPNTSKFYGTTKPTFSESLIKTYKFFQENFGIPATVFYPSCNLDASPLRAFDKSKVTLLDNDEDVVKALRRNGVEIIHEDVKIHRPREKYDFLILLNPQVRTYDASHTVRNGGYILTNNYHHNASQMFARPWSYRFIGLINDRDKDNFKIEGKKEAKKILF